jgi:hypothetical protein
MKEYHSIKIIPRYLVILMLSIVSITGQAQQNNTLFFMHSLPEANYLNPAVQIDCGIFVGLPLISSFHMNIANSGFTAGNLFTFYTDGSFSRKPDFNTERLARRNYFVSELHATLLAVGIKRNNLYYSFTITEKDNAAVLYTPDLIEFSLQGSGDFEGQSIGLKGTQIVFNHYREYALGISRKYSTNLTLGVKLKVLFGKFNFNTGNTAFNIYVEDGTRDLIFDIDGGFNSSLPYVLREENPGSYRFFEDYNAPMLKHLTNRRNPGFAFDLGFIYNYNDRLVLSGSLLDVGMILFRSNLSNYSLAGNYDYQGPFGYGAINDTQLWDMFDELNQNMNEGLTTDPYVHYLDPRLYLGAAYKLNNRFDLNFLLYNRLLPAKLQTGATVSLLTRKEKKFRTSISWSYMNNSPLNLGLGMVYGKKPLQLYFVSDNIIGFILPLSVKNVNLRLGINLNLSCRKEFSIDECGCDWLKNENNRRLRNAKFRRSK